MEFDGCNKKHSQRATELICIIILCATHVCCRAQQTSSFVISKKPDNQSLPVGRNAGDSESHSVTYAPSASVLDLTKTQRSSLSNHAAKPASVILQDKKLTIIANDSDLAQILRKTADISGMTIKGLGEGPRIFGVYGPAASRDVLAALLLDSGYNFIMVGEADDGIPDKLLLTVANNHNASSTLPAPSRIAVSDQGKGTKQETDSSTHPPLGPGAVAPVPSLDKEDEATRTQSNLRRLQNIQALMLQTVIQ